jgi:hypothetical protein
VAWILLFQGHLPLAGRAQGLRSRPWEPTTDNPSQRYPALQEDKDAMNTANMPLGAERTDESSLSLVSIAAVLLRDTWVIVSVLVQARRIHAKGRQVKEMLCEASRLERTAPRQAAALRRVARLIALN